jgi:predicted TIM-barrel fold metal-dependent hydrolase
MAIQNSGTIDVNASLGNWPFRLLRHNTPEGSLRLMDAHDIWQAWVASLDCVLNRELKTANLALAEATTPYRDRLVPFAVVNPNFPGWEADVEFFVREIGMAGIRTHPNYHTYTLSDPCFGELLACAEQYGVPLQIAIRVADERMHHPLVKVPPVDLGGLEGQLAGSGSVSIILLNVRQPELAAAAELAEAHPGVYIEISHIEFIGGVARLFDRFPERQVLFGTHAPLLYPLSALHKLREGDLNPEQSAGILRANAEGILAAR